MAGAAAGMATGITNVNDFEYKPSTSGDVVSPGVVSTTWPAMSMPNVQEVVNLFDRLRRYVGWQGEDGVRLQRAWPLVQPRVPLVVDDFYDAIQREPATARVITGGAAQIARLKGTLEAWIRELFCGPHDESYVVRRWKIGWRHVEIGLDQVFASAALCRLRVGLSSELALHWQGPLEELEATLTALHRALDLDLALIENAYHTEYALRQKQLERLATLGQVAGGIAHELRNPLNVIQTSVYYLLQAPDAPVQKKWEHLKRIERQVASAESVIAALNDFARLPHPDRRPVQLRDIFQEVLHELALPHTIDLQVDIPDSLPIVHVDARQMRIVFRNILANARDAVGRNGKIRIVATTEGNLVTVHVTDNGSGIPAELLPRVMEPLFTTKARGIGLGLPIARAILERHGARIGIVSQPGVGTTVSVTVPMSGVDDVRLPVEF